MLRNARDIHRMHRMHRMHRKHSRSGRPIRRAFTLLEIIVVVTIIALLATLVAPRLLGNIGKAKTKKATADVASLSQQVSLWMADNGYSRLPDDFDLTVLTTGEDAVLAAKYIVDPWGNPYILLNPGDENPDFDVVSYGADGEPGGEGEDEDIVN